MRNRILSGLSTATVMMECRIRSGSMTTITHALDQGREVYAWGGRLETEWAEGAYQLLREGARIFLRAEDILEDLGWQENTLQLRREAEAVLPPLDDNQRAVMQVLGAGEERSFDELAAATGLPPETLSPALTMLQLFGLVKAVQGKCFVRC